MSTQRPLADDLGFLLSRASGVVARSVSEALAPLDLRVRSYSVLTFACEETAGMTQRRLAAIMALDPSQIVALVDELQSRGLVHRTPDPADRRNKIISATDVGHRVAQDAQQRIDRAYNGHFDHVPPERLDELRLLLREIAFSDTSSGEPQAQARDA
ncbi:DNA-binding MarR family transcriptional regulator [Saccharopolyspora lacisalsi]|uniref:DNA-binding MarR family transcriptional regulator n=1 Tax=Halosaccharopolyspora lacisalsi TaxID=1000566 RepID=A0A839E0R3_9PSEU|nr:MarR family transcriptional regulator [Halosaccharopolyspora lacisalsi]MBA8825031.1 DNA-binding MarR family transcriptional regulator [Halosaccharopolyspora lacisalsi]